MNKKDLCELCEEYSVENKCENEKDCKIINLYKENQKLKKERKSLKKQLEKLKLKQSYMIDPIAVRNKNDMGW